MVCDPYGFWEQQRLFAPKGLSCNWLLGKFMIFTTDAELSRKALSINDEKTLLMAVHPAGKDILGENNLAFMHGPPHKAIRYVPQVCNTTSTPSTPPTQQIVSLAIHPQGAVHVCGAAG